MYSSLIRRSRPEIPVVILSAAALAFHYGKDDGGQKNVSAQTFSSCHGVTLCEKPTTIPFSPSPSSLEGIAPSKPSWIRRNILAPIGISLPLPRALTPQDPALKLPQKCIRQRQRDEVKMRQLLEMAPSMRGDPEKIKALSEQLFEVTYGKGVTAQDREDFLIRYGCTGWNDRVVERILDVAGSRGIVEMGAGHGQWQRALTEAYAKKSGPTGKPQKRFDFVLAYDDNSNLPLNTHIYNAFTKPHHEFFGNVRKLESKTDMMKILRSWACRGRVLLLVYPPPGEMAAEVVKTFVDAAPEDNDMVIYVGEGRGGANGDDALFDYFERGDWELVDELEVQRPPGDKGYEKLFILRRIHYVHS